ncbi:type II toxin-antitoxin system VapC family toxin [Jannaschia rubra]|uniref:Putative ribonuclease FitB n=1 Tax=Jannaschia rubra TaxID=282197 RepID=A0A0M6XPV7_9RHOB|nr:type II toxin-antitoxin system VapC family toxin [Jannaschia rubra]CTQ33149.1 putative ribonuclease FitB [Jannaschia rubra]SFG79588.1 hypothetical protein SAMN04488517_11612 [Jannaschia rubra]
MALLLDTNVVSELRKVQAGRADPGVARWQATVARTDLFVSAITLMELEMGVRLKERRDAVQGALLRRWMTEGVLAEFRDRTLPFDAGAALRCAALHIPDPRPWRDATLAATALVHDMTLVTRNLRDFRGTGVALLNPWEGEG